MHVEVRGQLSGVQFSLMWVPVSNLGHQAWWQAPVPMEPSYQLLQILKKQVAWELTLESESRWSPKTMFRRCTLWAHMTPCKGHLLQKQRNCLQLSRLAMASWPPRASLAAVHAAMIDPQGERWQCY